MSDEITQKLEAILPIGWEPSGCVDNNYNGLRRTCEGPYRSVLAQVIKYPGESVWNASIDLGGSIKDGKVGAFVVLKGRTPEGALAKASVVLSNQLQVFLETLQEESDERREDYHDRPWD